MGNCINKNRLCVLATQNFRRGSHQEYIQGRKNEGVERDNNVIAAHIHRPSPSPSPSGNIYPSLIYISIYVKLIIYMRMDLNLY